MVESIYVLYFFLIGIYETVLLLGGTVLWMGGLSHHPQKPTRIQKYFAMFFFCNAFANTHNTIVACILGQHSVLSDAWRMIPNDVCLGCLPILVIVLRQQTPHLKDWIKSFWPAALQTIATPILYRSHPEALYDLTQLILYYLIVANIWELYRMGRIDRELLDEYSDVEYKQTRWLRNSYIPYLCMVSTWIPWNYFVDQHWLSLLYYVGNSLVFIRITYRAVKQEEWGFTPNPSLVERGEICSYVDEECIHSTPLSKREGLGVSLWVDKLNEVMDKDALYRNPELNRDELAKAIGINRLYLSKYLNEQLNMTFFDYINDYRLKDACELLKTTDKSLDTISTECGFKSRTTFYTNFRKKYGMTPKEWRENNHSKR